MTNDWRDREINRTLKDIKRNLNRREYYENSLNARWHRTKNYPTIQSALDTIDDIRCHLFTKLDRLVCQAPELKDAVSNSR